MVRIQDHSKKTISDELIFDKIKKNNKTLDTLFYISQGIITGADRVSEKHIQKNLIGKDYLGSGIFILSQNDVDKIKLSKVEYSLLKPFFKNSDIRKYTSNVIPDKYILYLTRDMDLNKYPNIQKHILLFKKIIESRSYNNGEMQAGLKAGKWWVISKAKNGVIVRLLLVGMQVVMFIICAQLIKLLKSNTRYPFSILIFIIIGYIIKEKEKAKH